MPWKIIDRPTIKACRTIQARMNNRMPATMDTEAKYNDYLRRVSLR